MAEGAKEAAKLKISDLTGSRKMSGSSWADPCSTAEEAAGVPSGDTNQGVVVKIKMGSFVDYVRPVKGTPFCEMLASFKKHQVSKSPDGGFVTPSYFSQHLGGSAANWGNSWDGRKYAPSFWGRKAGAFGDGCCQNVAGGSIGWGTDYDIYR